MYMLFSGNYDGFVFFSADSNFVQLADHIRSRGKFVKVIEHENTTTTEKRIDLIFFAPTNLVVRETIFALPRCILPTSLLSYLDTILVNILLSVLNLVAGHR